MTAKSFKSGPGVAAALMLFTAGALHLRGDWKEAVYADGSFLLKVSVRRTDVLIKSTTDEVSFPGLIDFGEKLIIPYHRNLKGAKWPRGISAMSTDGGKSWSDLPPSSPFSDDLENSGLYGYTRTGEFLYIDTFPMQAKKNPEEWGSGYHNTQKVGRPTWRVRRFSTQGELASTWEMKMTGLPWESASYENYGSIVELTNGDLLTVFQCLVDRGPGNVSTEYGFSPFVARSRDGGKTFRHVWTFDPRRDGKRIGDEGLCEPDIAVLPNGEILCVMRSGSYSPLYQARSKDGGTTWSKPASIGWPGVKPKLRLLKNGVLACTSGRGAYGNPQVTYAMFSIDGTGEKWEVPFTFYTGLSDNYTWNMERNGDLYVVYSVLSATNPPYQFENKLPFESIRWSVLHVSKEKRR